MLCGPYAAVIMSELMVARKTVREVQTVRFNPWLLRPWLYRCLHEMKLHPPPYL